MTKPYEIYGIPDKCFYGYDEPPDYAFHSRFFGSKSAFEMDRKVEELSYEMSLWGFTDYWTPLEAALLLVGIQPDCDCIYEVYRYDEPFIGLKTPRYFWQHDAQFEYARDYLFLFERSTLAPKAPHLNGYNTLI